MKLPIITIDDFRKIDIRVGQITAAVIPEGSQKLIQFTVDLGPDYGIFTILSGIAPFYIPESFIGKKYLFLANLQERKMMGIPSQGMFMAGDQEGKPTLIEVPADLPIGLKII